MDERTEQLKIQFDNEPKTAPFFIHLHCVCTGRFLDKRLFNNGAYCERLSKSNDARILIAGRAYIDYKLRITYN